MFELWVNHVDTVYRRVVAFIGEVGAIALERKALAAALRRRKEAIADPKVSRMSCVVFLRQNLS